ncbi:hypothetical protein [Acidovorax sp. 100]|uniref:hypothetical protein n=1 Tax=Acidovorax sp. 100 TaxID=2135635 RepID=UPI0011C362FA|nr:hypothetical protein [Acidovorax sp. 100]
MTNSDVSHIVNLIRTWKGGALTWEAVRLSIGSSLELGDQVWSRQALQANEDIQLAWLAKKESRKTPPMGKRRSDSDVNDLLESTLAANRELQMKYDNLAFRHRQLLYNASLLAGGAHLLVDPLPNNTADQSAYR